MVQALDQHFRYLTNQLEAAQVDALGERRAREGAQSELGDARDQLKRAQEEIHEISSKVEQNKEDIAQLQASLTQAEERQRALEKDKQELTKDNQKLTGALANAAEIFHTQAAHTRQVSGDFRKWLQRS